MVAYRRNRQEGASYFFTVTLKNRQASLLTDHIDILRRCFKHCKTNNPFYIDAVVVLPEHLHTIWTLPVADDAYSKRWRLIKAAFTRELQKEGLTSQKNKYGGHSIWQRRYWEHTLRNERDFNQHVDYIHYNPVKHGLVNRVSDWPYSSFHRYVNAGTLHNDWGSEPVSENGRVYGE